MLTLVAQRCACYLVGSLWKEHDWCSSHSIVHTAFWREDLIVSCASLRAEGTCRLPSAFYFVFVFGHPNLDFNIHAISGVPHQDRTLHFPPLPHPSTTTTTHDYTITFAPPSPSVHCLRTLTRMSQVRLRQNRTRSPRSSGIPTNDDRDQLTVATICGSRPSETQRCKAFKSLYVRVSV